VKKRMSNFESPMTVTQDWVIWHTIDLYLHTKFNLNPIYFPGWTLQMALLGRLSQGVDLNRAD